MLIEPIQLHKKTGVAVVFDGKGVREISSREALVALEENGNGILLSGRTLAGAPVPGWISAAIAAVAAGGQYPDLEALVDRWFADAGLSKASPPQVVH